MELPNPTHAVSAFASFVRERLAEVSATLTPIRSRRDGVDVPAAGRNNDAESVGAARHLAMVIIGAAAPFATSSHARARLLRQAHASGLLSAGQTQRAGHALALTAGSAGGSEREVFGASG